MLWRRGRDQQVEAILFEAIEVEMPRDDPGAPGGGTERRHLLLRPGDRQPVIQPVGVGEPQRRTAPGVTSSRRRRRARGLSRVRAIARLRGVLRRDDRQGTGRLARACVSSAFRSPAERTPAGKSGTTADGAGADRVERTWRRASRRRLGLQPFEQGIGRLGDLGRGRARARHALAFRSRRELRRARTRRIASAPRRRCSTLPQRSILRNTGPNRVSDARSQSRSACTGQALGLAPQATATWHTGSPARVSSTAAPGEAQPLDVETDQRETPEPGGHQQQQGAIAQPGEIPGASGRHAHQLGGPRRRGATGASGAAAGLPENGFHQRIGDRRSETAPAVLVGDGGGAAAQRAGAQPCRGGAEKAATVAGAAGSAATPAASHQVAKAVQSAL